MPFFGTFADADGKHFDLKAARGERLGAQDEMSLEELETTLETLRTMLRGATMDGHKESLAVSVKLIEMEIKGRREGIAIGRRVNLIVSSNE